MHASKHSPFHGADSQETCTHVLDSLVRVLSWVKIVRNVQTCRSIGKHCAVPVAAAIRGSDTGSNNSSHKDAASEGKGNENLGRPWELFDVLLMGGTTPTCASHFLLLARP